MLILSFFFPSEGVTRLLKAENKFPIVMEDSSLFQPGR